MDAIILVGGMGTRLREVVSDIPKPLAPVCGKPFLDLLITQLEGRVKRIILAVGYKAELIKAHYATKSFIFSEEDVPLGTGGALKKALKNTSSSSVLVLNGDSYFGIDLEAFHAFHQNNRSDLTLACQEVNETDRFGLISYDEFRRIKSFQEKKKNTGKGWINGGIYLLRRDLLNDFADTPFSLEHEGFPYLLNKRVFAYPSNAQFIDIGTKESYFQAQEVLCNVFSTAMIVALLNSITR